MIYNEDCLVGMNRIPDASVDLILTDLPYGITDCAFDKRLPFEPLWKQFWRVAKPNAAVVLFSVGKFTIELAYSQLKYYRYEWIWQKNLAVGFLNAKKMPLRAHENILVFYRKLPTYNPQFTKGKPYKTKYTSGTQNYGKVKTNFNYKMTDGRRYPRDVFSEDRLQEYHAQQKPTALLEYLIRTYSNEGELVLDATMGSGSTGVAAINTGRKFIGFEIEEDYFNIAKQRIEQAQRGLF